MPEWEEEFEKVWPPGSNRHDAAYAIARSWYRLGFETACKLAAQQLAEADSVGGRAAAEAVLESYRVLRQSLRPRERVFWNGKPYRDAVCELWDTLQDVLAAHRAA